MLGLALPPPASRGAVCPRRAGAPPAGGPAHPPPPPPLHRRPRLARCTSVASLKSAFICIPPPTAQGFRGASERDALCRAGASGARLRGGGWVVPPGKGRRMAHSVLFPRRKDARRAIQGKERHLNSPLPTYPRPCFKTKTTGREGCTHSLTAPGGNRWEL